VSTVAHISDLHFGTELPAVADALLKDLHEQRPALVVVSGDLTQRARSRQFAAARDYLARLPQPQLVVPGNHDVPLFDVVRRFLFPLTRYRRLICSDLNPTFADDQIFVAGINTARSFTWKNGRISVEQIEDLQRRLELAGTRIKIVVTHHPFIPPPHDVGIDLVGRAAYAITVLDAANVDVLLAGHLHQGYAGDVRTHYPAARRSILAVQAGTAISHRMRADQSNAYNLLTLERTEISIEVRGWSGREFATLHRSRYERAADGWVPAQGASPGSVAT
jgi:3',5'-cyclic AMP phosphodiesterase CpdA